MGNRKHFCCCISDKVTVFITSLLSLIGSALSASAFFWIAHTIDTQNDIGEDSKVETTSGARIGLIFAGVLFVVIGIISLFGFIGSVIRNRRMVKAYSILAWVCFILSIGLNIFLLYFVFAKSSLIRCWGEDLDEISCDSFFTTGRRVGFVISTFICLIPQLCICIVIMRYAEQLENEQAQKNDFGLNKNSTSYPFRSIESNQGVSDSKH